MFRRYAFLACALLFAVGGAFFVAHTAVQADTLSSEQRAALQAQYDQLLREIAEQQKIIDDTRAKERSLQGDVTALSAQIKAAQAQIDAKNIQMKQLAGQIATKTRVIGQLSDRIARGHESLASLLRQQNQLEDTSLIEVALSAKSVSEFFADVDAIVSIQNSLASLFADIRANKNAAETEKAALTATQNKVADAKYVVETKQKQIAGDKTQKQQLLAITANQEAQYQKVLAANQAKAASIRAALFPLRDAAAISFGTALKYAQDAQKTTNVDPSLVLAVLTQESNLGANVGQCYLSDNDTGAGVGKTSGKAFSNVMNPRRDVPPFVALSLKLGFDPHRQVVSCPIAGAGGWGGAMGPAQFIPSTWALYAARVATARGEAEANPWDPADAIMAMSIYLGQLGASSGGYTADHTAAAKYYAGGAWATAGKAYANQVMAKVASIQSNIDFLANN